MQDIRWIIIILLNLLYCSSALANTYAFRSLSRADGLSDLKVSALYKDSNGFLWVGTATSVERFDGVRFKHYPIHGNSEKKKWVNVIAEIEGHRILVGNDMGLWEVKSERLNPIGQDTIKGGVREIISDHQGNLYLGSETGLWIRKYSGEWERIILDNNPLTADNSISAMCLDEKNNLWILTRKDLYLVELNNERKTTLFINPLFGKHLSCSYRTVKRIGDLLYIGTMEQGIICFNTVTKQFSRFMDIGCNVINQMTTDGKDLLYVGTDGGGVFFVSTRQQKIIQNFSNNPNEVESLRSNSVYSLLLDRDGILWVGLYQFGLNFTYYKNCAFSVYSFPPYFDSKNIAVRTLNIGEHEKMIGSRNGLFYINERNGNVKTLKTPLLRSNIILCCATFMEKYYIGTYGGGLYIFNPSDMSVQDFRPQEKTPFLNGHIFCVKADVDNKLWIGTSSGVYCYQDDKVIYHCTMENSPLPGNNVYDIMFDSTGKGWICTENGLAIWDPYKKRVYADVFPSGFIHKEKIKYVYEDSEHKLYFIPDKERLFISDLSMNHYAYLAPNSLLEGKEITFVIEDKQNWLWLGTNDGLYHYDKKNTFIPYSFADGVPSSIFLSCTPVTDHGENMWFGNSNGLLKLGANWQSVEEKTRYSVAISEIMVDGEAQNLVLNEGAGYYECRLEMWRRNVTVNFSGLTYTDPSHMFYEYRLREKDDEWQILTGNSTLTFYELFPGSYKLKVRRMGAPQSETTLNLYISLPLIYYIGLFSLIGILMLAGVYFYLRRTEQIQSITKWCFKSQPANEESEIDGEKKYRTTSVTVEECEELLCKVRKCMDTQKLYLNPDLKLNDLATATGASIYTLSYLFNQYLHSGYYDFVNSCRLAEFKLLIEKGAHTKYTLNALIEMCGFNSRTSFFRYFKKINGIYPSEYIKTFEKQN